MPLDLIACQIIRLIEIDETFKEKKRSFYWLSIHPRDTSYLCNGFPSVPGNNLGGIDAFARVISKLTCEVNKITFDLPRQKLRSPRKPN